ncbi:MAG: thioredoxin domain-containing protein [Anaerolineales bacterium]|nr:thioredoxin domain-containing protein [Chloroflexota bacterium]MBL6979904.1 thioredoxin domain-containing protein [Anaerolineales bacterium]
MPNRLANENSPYLLQHAENPVDWYPWGEEALEKANTEDKPIFLSVGYAACHWCHVMEHESFEDPETAALMNEHFVNIKVDREERPDIDNIYMQAVVAMTGQGGWPMSVFLTPDGQPFYGGTYFPPEPRYRMPSFKDVLHSVERIWREDREKLLESGEKITAHLKATGESHNAGGEINPSILSEAAMRLAQAYDWKNGGWGQAPKFPQPMAIEFLLRQASRGDRMALDMTNHALKSMAKGGMYDVAGGGFARYSVDDFWLVPHFEKMLYDNAQLALAYLHAYLITADEEFRRVCEETLDFVLREMTHPEGGFYSSLDADSEGEEGKFYVWTSEEIQAVISDPEDSRLFLAAYGVTQQGNFEGHTVLQRVLDDDQIAEEFGLPIEEVPKKLAEIHALLLEKRTERIRPGTDDKVLVSWNGLMLSAFAEAGRYLKRPDYVETAIRNADFLLTALHPDDRLLRSWRDGKARYNGYLEDYAAMILGLLALYQSDPNPRWFSSASELAIEMITRFRDPDGGFFDTRDDHEKLLYRPKDLQDNAVPSGNALAALALLQLSAFELNLEWRDMAEAMMAKMGGNLARYPTGFGQWLIAADFALGPVNEVAIIGDSESAQTQALVEMLWKQYQPHLVAAISEEKNNLEGVENLPGFPKLLENRGLFNDQSTAYVCQGFVCQQPVNTPEELAEQLNN